jgi:hypothetical protein
MLSSEGGSRGQQVQQGRGWIYYEGPLAPTRPRRAESGAVLSHAGLPTEELVLHLDKVPFLQIVFLEPLPLLLILPELLVPPLNNLTGKTCSRVSEDTLVQPVTQANNRTNIPKLIQARPGWQIHEADRLPSVLTFSLSSWALEAFSIRSKIRCRVSNSHPSYCPNIHIPTARRRQPTALIGCSGG